MEGNTHINKQGVINPGSTLTRKTTVGLSNSRRDRSGDQPSLLRVIPLGTGTRETAFCDPFDRTGAQTGLGNSAKKSCLALNASVVALFLGLHDGFFFEAMDPKGSPLSLFGSLS